MSNGDYRFDAVVVGGGLAGLAAAATIASAGMSVLVRERQQALGGCARSSQQSGFTLNRGPHALFRNGPAHRILSDLGVIVSGVSPKPGGRLIVHGSQHRAPAGPFSLLATRALSARAKFDVGRMLQRLPSFAARDFATTSTTEWLGDQTDNESALGYLHALVRLATYCSEPDELSAEVAIAQLQSALGHGVLYLHGGWQPLVDQLAAMPGITTQTNDTVTKLPDAPVVIIAGAPSMAESLLGNTFAAGPPAQVSCLDLGLSRKPNNHFVLGIDTPSYFSDHSTAELAPEDSYYAAVMQYLAAGDEPDVEQLTDFASYAGVTTDDVIFSRKLHRMTAVSAVATATSGGLAERPLCSATGLDNVFIAGDWVGPTGHLADASVSSGRVAGLAAIDRLRQRVRA